MSGKQTAAATKAQAASDYGVPKKAKSRKPQRNRTFTVYIGVYYGYRQRYYQLPPRRWRL